MRSPGRDGRLLGVSPLWPRWTLVRFVGRRVFRPYRDCGLCWDWLPTDQSVGYCRVSLAGQGDSLRPGRDGVTIAHRFSGGATVAGV